MDTTQLGVIALLRSGITGERADLPEQFDIEQAYSVLRHHGAVALGYVGAVNCGIDRQLPAMQKLRMDYAACLFKSQAQMAAVEKLCRMFDSNGIDYMPLKGCNMKRLYPNHELRGMSDADILIRPEQYDKIRPIMQQLGFVEQTESDHELHWSSKAVHMELHKRLIPITNRDYYRYYGDGWKMAKVREGFRHAMTDEDQFVYLFTHFAKHYRNGGGGCRHVVDLWVYLRHYSNLDMAYIRQELKVLELDAFFENMLALIAAWFGDGQWSPVTEFMSEVIFANGNWGNAKTHSIAELLRKQHKGDSAGRGKLRWLLWRVFPPCRALCGEYQVLKKWPVLLPLVWIVRWVKTLFAHRNKIKRDLNILVETSTEEIEAQERALFYVGLKFEK